MSPAIAAKGWVAAVRAVGLAGAAVAAATNKRALRAAEVAVIATRCAESEAWDRLEARRLAYLAQCTPLQPDPDLPEEEPQPEPESAPGEVA